MDFINPPILLFGLLLTGCILTSLISFRAGIPLILIFLCIGLLLGDGGLDLLESFRLPKAAFSIGSVALALILFDSGFHTPIKRYNKSVIVQSGILASLGVLLTTFLFAPVVFLTLGTTWLGAFLLASVISSTDSASVFFLLRSKGLLIRDKIKSTLELESGANDPMSIFLTLSCILLIQQISVPVSDKAGELALFFLLQTGVGILGGFLLGFILKFFVNKLNLEAALFPIFVLGLTLLGFSLVNICSGSGFLAVYLAGLILGNARIQAHTPLSKFQQTLGWFSQIILFTSLGLFVSFEELKSVWGIGLLLGLMLTFVIRPVMVFAILTFSKIYTVKEKLFISFVGLRGATSVLLAIAPIVYALPDAEEYFGVVFIMVLLSLSIQGFFLPLVAKWCGVTVPVFQNPPEQTQVDLPGLTDASLIMYKLSEKTPALNGTPIPKWAKPILIIRDGVSFAASNIHHLKENDAVYVLITADTRRCFLDNLFGGGDTEAVQELGDFPISANTRFEELERIYGIHIPKKILSLTIKELINQEFNDVEVGDRLSLSAIDLVVRETENGQPTLLGVDIDPSRAKKQCARIVKI